MKINWTKPYLKEPKNGAGWRNHCLRADSPSGARWHIHKTIYGYNLQRGLFDICTVRTQKAAKLIAQTIQDNPEQKGGG